LLSLGGIAPGRVAALPPFRSVRERIWRPELDPVGGIGLMVDLKRQLGTTGSAPRASTMAERSQ
jgi:hypothetical protein